MSITSTPRRIVSKTRRVLSRSAPIEASRWLGVYEKRDILQKYVFSGHLTGVDVGGARGPISLEVDICDRLDKDIFRRDVKYHDISEIPDGSLDYAWSSHTLEHIPNLEDFIGQLRHKLKVAGCYAIDEVVGRHFVVDEAAMVGDNSIFLIATR